jgi:hypothetical protein
MNKRRVLPKDEQGSLLVAGLLVGMLMIGLGIVLGNMATAQLVRTNRNISELNALQVAEAGIEKSISQLNVDEEFTGFPDEEFFNNQRQGVGIFTTEIIDGAEDEKFIISTGSVYRYQDEDGDPLTQRRLRVTVVGTESDGFSVHTGPGGLLLGGNASITNSDVHINGFVELDGFARIGTENDPRGVNIANIRCPLVSNPGDDYPEQCSSGNEPLTVGSNARIYGTVCATHQTDDTNIYEGDGGEGLVAGCIAPEVQPPEYDRQAHIDEVTIVAPSSDNQYRCHGSNNNVTWPDGLQLSGNVNLGGNCTVVIEGDIYITGNFRTGGSSTVRIADSVEEEQPNIVVDGEIDVGGSGQFISNNQGVGGRFMSFKSEADCSPDCTDLSGNDLYNSQSVTTVDLGSGVNLAGMVFQSYWGTARLAGGGSVGAIAGQTVDLRGSGTVVFGTILSSGEKTWRATSYQELPVLD